MDTLTRLLVISIVGCVEADGLRREYAGEPLVFAAVPLHAPVPVLRVLSATPLRVRPRRPAAADLDPQETAPAPVPRYKPATRAAAAPKQRLRPSTSAFRDITDYEDSYAGTGAASYEYTRLTPPALASAAHSYEDEYEVYAPQPAYSTAHVYSTSSLAQPGYEAVHAGSAEPLLYARPLPSGGYTYRRAAPKVAAVPPPPAKPAKEPPYIIKIHKYRIVKDRRRR